MYLNGMIPPHNDTRANSDEPNSNTKTKIVCPDDDNNTLNYTAKTSKKRLMPSQTPGYIRNSNSRTSKQNISAIQGMKTE